MPFSFERKNYWTTFTVHECWTLNPLLQQDLWPDFNYGKMVLILKNPLASWAMYMQCYNNRHMANKS
jgi:hypothetical protein